jgi:hypothetical protein
VLASFPCVSFKKIDFIEFPSAFPSRGSLRGKKASRGWMSERRSVVGEASTRPGLNKKAQRKMKCAV